MAEKTLETFYPNSVAAWRSWLKKNHKTENSVWVLFYKVKSEKPSLTWSQAVDEALCFGWIDSTKKSIDSESYRQFFSKRKPKSIWSKVNKDKVAELIATNRMQAAGLKCIEIAKENGSWEFLNAVDNLEVPTDLQQAFDQNPVAFGFYKKLSPSNKKGILYWIKMAKRQETRDKRIEKIIDSTLASEVFKPFW